MRLAIIADVFPPLRSSGAVQLRDLSVEFARQGHEVTMIVSSPDLTVPWTIEMWDGVQVLRLRTLKTKETSYVRRTIGEFLMPFWMLRNLRKSPLGDQRWDGVVWYSPTIFLGPIVKALKLMSGCRSYLIVRDIFPEWAVDMGLMGRGLPYQFFKSVEKYQYSVADVIGIQTPANRSYFKEWQQRSAGKVEVLQNWLADKAANGCSISVAETPLAGRKIFVYAGNMGVAQGAEVLVDLAEMLRARSDIGFLLVGRGSAVPQLRKQVANRGLDNIAILDEIEPDEIPGLYKQCHIGLVLLDPRHKTHNIPGKFLSYMQAGLPVLASVNPGNDLEGLIKLEGVGRVSADASIQALFDYAQVLIEDMSVNPEMPAKCKALAAKLYSPDVAVRQIVDALQP